ncbi:MAG: thiamine pyrophosphate-dependent enzyme [Candidatus Bipolaricaulota bacterium]
MKKIVTGNEALALGALRAGVRVVTGYPGTPSTEALASLLLRDLPGRHVEWSTNEKVAFEIAAGAAWAGRRALCTMKMSGLNVAYDAVVSIAYSGTNGGLVVYVADDPGVSAGMPEQDTRGFALMTDAPMLEPSSVEEAYRFAQLAFDLSEAIGGLVFLRLTTAVALTHAIVQVDDEGPLEPPSPPLLERDNARYTKAGSAICLGQHEALLERLEAAGRWLHERGAHRLTLGKPGGLGVIAVGAPVSALGEGLAAAGLNAGDVSILRAASTVPFPVAEVETLLGHVGAVLVLEELEPHLERDVLLAARRVGFAGPIVGKLDGTLSRSGEYGMAEIVAGLVACSSRPVGAVGEAPQATSYKLQAEPAPRPITVAAGAGGRCEDHLTEEPSGAAEFETVLSCAHMAAPRPITVCAGCPHRGTYMAIEAAIKKAGFKQDEVMVTGDIGCTILGMNPPFDLLWNEVSMGSSVSLAQGYVHAGLTTPVVATIGDSTFFHGGIPGLLNAVQHRTPLVVVVMDNGWTAMTGMQVNPGTDEGEQRGGRRIDLATVIPALGVDRFAISDPFDLAATTAILTDFLKEATGVRVLLARQECAIQSRRRGAAGAPIQIDAAKCVLCKRCIQITGCPALSFRSPTGNAAGAIVIDAALCNGCGLCAAVCPTQALGCPPGRDGGQLGSKPDGGGFDGKRGGRP